jgi:energy-coupling factor transporter transmembrane protein EcfT
VIGVLLFASHLSLRQLFGSLKSLWLMVIFLLIIYIVTPRTSSSLGIAFKIYDYPIYWDSFAEAGKILIRLDAHDRAFDDSDRHDEAARSHFRSGMVYDAAQMDRLSVSHRRDAKAIKKANNLF